MRSLSCFLTLAGALALAGCSADSAQLLAPTPSARLSASVPTASTRYLVAASNAGFGSDFESRVAALGGSIESIHADGGFAVVSGLSADAAASLAKAGGVSDVQQDVEISLAQPVTPIQADALSLGDVTTESAANPAGAILFSRQWNMRLIGANKAWAANKLGSAGVTVAILDTGIDYNINDVNGLVDLSRSKSFVLSDDSIATKFFPTRNKIDDFNGHGTNVATQVSSKAFAFAGVTSQTTLIGVKVLRWDGHGYLSSVLNGLLWAADHGADVANMSLAGGFEKSANPKDTTRKIVGAGRAVSIINRVFNYAGKKGTLIVVAAGNEASDLDHNGNVDAAYCDQAHVVCVSAVGPASAAGLENSGSDEPSYYTNFGRSAISVAGPGGNGDGAHGLPKTQWPWGLDRASWVYSLCARNFIQTFTATGTPVRPCSVGLFITGAIGTSQATPHVAGLAALLVAEHGHGNPSQIKHLIEQSADDLGQPGTDPFYGRGRINVAKALGL